MAGRVRGEIVSSVAAEAKSGLKVLTRFTACLCTWGTLLQRGVGGGEEGVSYLTMHACAIAALIASCESILAKQTGIIVEVVSKLTKLTGRWVIFASSTVDDMA